VLIWRPQEIVVVSTTLSPGCAGLGDAEIVHELIPTEPVSRVVVVVARAVVVVGLAVVVVARWVVVVARTVVVVGSLS
jgi:hypothetical protein